MSFSRTSTARKKRQQDTLYRMQHGLCYWCGCLMQKPTGEPIKTLPDNYGTIDHLDDKWSKQRGAFECKNVRRRVMACSKCNNERSRGNYKFTLCCLPVIL